MQALFDELSFVCSEEVTNSYSTSFSSAVKMLAPEIQPAIHSIYGFVRFADEIVDTFHGWDKEALIEKFEADFYEALEIGISLNPILHSFQQTVRKYNIDLELIDAFLKSMKMDLVKKNYETQQEYEEYIYGSADAVGLMCLKIFVNGDEQLYNKLKGHAMRLGSAFQKVNFLRDLKSDTELLERSYFPNVDLKNLQPKTKKALIEEIERDFADAYIGICQLPESSKFGVHIAYKYYSQLLRKLSQTPSNKIMETRIRVSKITKMRLLLQSYFSVKMSIV